MRDISASVSFPRQFIVRIAFVFLLLLAVGIFSPSGVRADNFAVSTPAELSAAINNANNEGTYPGLDVITLTAAAFTVSAADNASSVAGDNNAFPVITSDITITYAGPGRATVERSGGTPMRFFEVAPGGYFTLENIVLDNGLAQWGGAIYNRGTTGLTNAILQDNQAVGEAGEASTIGAPGPGGGGAGMGGAVFNDTGASLFIADTTLRQNSAVGGKGGDGAPNGGTVTAIGKAGGGPNGGSGGAIAADGQPGGFGSGGGGGGSDGFEAGSGGAGGFGGGGGGGGGVTFGCGAPGFPICDGLGGGSEFGRSEEHHV